MDKVIISLREAINIGSSVAKVIEAVSCEYFDSFRLVKYTHKNGDEGEVPVRNITGIVYKKCHVK
jgi:hypothetical protein